MKFMDNTPIRDEADKKLKPTTEPVEKK